MKYPMVDRNTYAYQICMESFNAMATEQPVKDRYGYRDAAMEAMTGPDAGMVIEKLYRGISARSGINFGKIPDSMGDLTSFSKYKSIEETFILLDRDLAAFKVEELKMAHELHDNLIRLRDDFQWGYKTDSQFLKTTYNSMVYALCELLNLCTVVYIDALKAAVEQKKFVYVPYKDLLLVQNVAKFNKMVTTGEWSQMVLQLRRGGKGLLGIQDTHGVSEFAKLMSGIGLFGVGFKNLEHASGGDPAKAQEYLFSGKAYKAAKDAVVKFSGTAGGKVILFIMCVIGVLMIIRALINIFWRCTYSLRDILQDNEQLLAANMACANDNSSTSLEKQQKMYETLKGLREKIESAIISDDKKGKKNLQESNASDLTREDLNAASSGEASAFTFG